MKNPLVLKATQQHIRANRAPAPGDEQTRHTKNKDGLFSCIYLSILACKTWRIAPKASSLRLKPWWVWRATAVERRTSRIQRAGTHQPTPSHPIPTHPIPTLPSARFVRMECCFSPRNFCFPPSINLTSAVVYQPDKLWTNVLRTSYFPVYFFIMLLLFILHYMP